MSQNPFSPEEVPEWFTDLPLDAQQALVELGVVPAEWVSDSDYAGKPPDWVTQIRSAGYWGFLSPVGLGPLYAGSMLTRAFTAGWLTNYGLDPGGYGYQARSDAALMSATSYAQWATGGALYGNALNANYMMSQSSLWAARGAYYNFQQAWTPAAEAWGGVRIASYFNPQAWGVRAFGFPFYGAAQQIGAGQAMGPFVQQALTQDPTAINRIMASPTFWPYQYQDLRSAILGGVVEWTGLQMGLWALQGKLGGMRGLSVGFTQAGLGLMMEPVATMVNRASVGIPMFLNEGEMWNVITQEVLGVGLLAGGVAAWLRGGSLFGAAAAGGAGGFTAGPIPISAPGKLGYVMTGFPMAEPFIGRGAWGPNMFSYGGRAYPRDPIVGGLPGPSGGGEYAFGPPQRPSRTLNTASRLLWGTVGWYAGVEIAPSIGRWFGQNFPASPIGQTLSMLGFDVQPIPEVGEAFAGAIIPPLLAGVAAKFGPRATTLALNEIFGEIAVKTVASRIAATLPARLLGGVLPFVGPLLALEMFGELSEMGVNIAAQSRAGQLFMQGVPSAGISKKWSYWDISEEAQALGRIPYAGFVLEALYRGARYGQNPLTVLGTYEAETVEELRGIEASPWGIAYRRAERILDVFNPIQKSLNELEVERRRFRPQITAAYTMYQEGRSLINMLPAMSFTRTYEEYQAGLISYDEYMAKYKEYRAYRAWMATPAYGAYAGTWQDLSGTMAQYDILRSRSTDLQQAALNKLGALDFRFLMGQYSPTFDFNQNIGMGGMGADWPAWTPNFDRDRAEAVALDKLIAMARKTFSSRFTVLQSWATLGYAARFGEVPYMAPWMGTNLDPYMAQGGISLENPLSMTVLFDPNIGAGPSPLPSDSRQQALWRALISLPLQHVTWGPGVLVGDVPVEGFVSRMWGLAGQALGYEQNPETWPFSGGLPSGGYWRPITGGLEWSNKALPTGGWFNPYTSKFGRGTPPAGARGLGPMAGWTRISGRWVYTGGMPAGTTTTTSLGWNVTVGAYTRGGLTVTRTVRRLINGVWTTITEAYDPDSDSWSEPIDPTGGTLTPPPLPSDPHGLG